MSSRSSGHPPAACPARGELTRPLPRSVVALLDTAEVEHHERLADRFGKATGALIAADRDMKSAEQADRDAAAEAARALRPLPEKRRPRPRSERRRPLVGNSRP